MELQKQHRWSERDIMYISQRRAYDGEISLIEKREL